MWPRQSLHIAFLSDLLGRLNIALTLRLMAVPFLGLPSLSNFGKLLRNVQKPPEIPVCRNFM